MTTIGMAVTGEAVAVSVYIWETLATMLLNRIIIRLHPNYAPQPGVGLQLNIH
jgi:hypothetical protein